MSQTTTAMNFVSYAQNYEDVMLWRALQHVERGFYIDVGAWSPDADSITRAFYERGWRGINVEPNAEWHARLQARRPEDLNLPVAVSDAPGTQTFYNFANLGIATMDAAVAEAHTAEGWTAEPSEMTVTTLNAVWAEHVGDRQVHFLKVDVEGLEELVLRGNDWRAHRPWIVVVESTRPLSQVESHDQWEPLLTEADYVLAYVDGLNRFYVAAEHAELLPALKYPPNVFDRFELAVQHEQVLRAEAAEARIAELEATIAVLEGHAAAAGERAANAEAQAVEAQARAATAEGHAADAGLRAARAEEQAVEAQSRAIAAETRAAEAEGRAEAAETQLGHIVNSKIWRYTRPIRMLKAPLAAMRPSRD